MDSPPEFMAMTEGKAATSCARRSSAARTTGSSCRSSPSWSSTPASGRSSSTPASTRRSRRTRSRTWAACTRALYNIDMKPEQAISAQLREQKGIEPSDVRVAIMTHLHMDHASAISEFTSATYVLGAGEWRAFHAVAVRAERIRAPPRRARGRVQGGAVRQPGDRLVLDVRALVRPVRRRLRATRPHPGPHARPPVGDPAPEGPRGARDRRRDLLHCARSRTSGAAG